jgi:hypothetical protein
MDVKKYTLAALVAVGAVFGARVDAVAGPVAADSCPQDFNFEKALAKDLTKCIKGFNSWITGLESTLTATQEELAAVKGNQPKAEVIGAGTVSIDGKDLQSWLGSTVEMSSDETIRGQYKVTFSPSLKKAPMVMVGSTRASGISVVTATDASRFTVRSDDASGPIDAGFWFVVLSP